MKTEEGTVFLIDYSEKSYALKGEESKRAKEFLKSKLDAHWNAVLSLWFIAKSRVDMIGGYEELKKVMRSRYNLNMKKIPISKGVMVFDTEYGASHLLQLSYIISYPDGNTSTPVNFYFDHPTEFDNDKDRNGFNYAVRNINHLTKERLKQLGTSPKHEAINKFFDDMSSVDLLVAHDKDEDISRIEVEKKREKDRDNKIEDSEWKPCFCTMNDQSYMKGASLKSLSENLKIDYENYYRGADGKDSVLDSKITLECFKKLCEKGYVFSPDGEYIKDITTVIKERVDDKDVAKEESEELKFSDDKIYDYDFVGKRFIVSKVSDKEKKNLRDAITKLGATWTSNIKGSNVQADFLVAGKNFTPVGASDKYPKAVARQKEGPYLIVFSEEKMREYLYSLI